MAMTGTVPVMYCADVAADPRATANGSFYWAGTAVS
jgi:hypothetical protein